jgi:lipopolysaccharide/colanic/teichoic acid biosynthesis glycosyltransferase
MRAVTNPTLVSHVRPLAEYATVKRVFDLLVAAILLVILAPVLLACALAIKLDSRGPVLHRQVRVGEGGRRFSMLKFRSMVAHADTLSHRDYALAYINGAAQRQEQAGQALFKLADDPRITRVGTWLRRTSLDELPQLWNVVRGDMSLVGPRPPLQYEVEHYQPSHLLRLAARPGITGLWQVRGRGRTTFEEMVAIDCEYIRTQSIGLDVRILLSTIPVVVRCRDAR